MTKYTGMIKNILSVIKVGHAISMETSILIFLLLTPLNLSFIFVFNANLNLPCELVPKNRFKAFCLMMLMVFNVIEIEYILKKKTHALYSLFYSKKISIL